MHLACRDSRAAQPAGTGNKSLNFATIVYPAG